jgi:TPR repeat protein
LSLSAWLWLVLALALVLLASVFWRARGLAVAVDDGPESPSADAAGGEGIRREEGIARSPGHPEDRGDDPAGAFDLGLGLEQQGDLAGARAAYERAMQAGHPAAACNLGVLLGGQGDLPGAEAAFRHADRRGDPAGAFNLGLLLEDQGDLDGARTSFRRAVALGPSEVAELAHAALRELEQASPAPIPGGAPQET